ncbi:hypothetical protein KFK09_008891 [Dendrobium nobile]|uniref:Uncharacterized protein n=1 Tax=Dendrobium nobile TaxID=94219 RepID=A0A8T3BP05_DENNO|nr:hypothetical protein KFK09_008891 [Dendrobium nobile]
MKSDEKIFTILAESVVVDGSPSAWMADGGSLKNRSRDMMDSKMGLMDLSWISVLFVNKKVKKWSSSSKSSMKFYKRVSFKVKDITFFSLIHICIRKNI